MQSLTLQKHNTSTYTQTCIFICTYHACLDFDGVKITYLQYTYTSLEKSQGILDKLYNLPDIQLY